MFWESSYSANEEPEVERRRRTLRPSMLGGIAPSLLVEISVISFLSAWTGRKTWRAALAEQGVGTVYVQEHETHANWPKTQGENLRPDSSNHRTPGEYH